MEVFGFHTVDENLFSPLDYSFTETYYDAQNIINEVQSNGGKISMIPYDINDNIIIESKDIYLLDKFKKHAFNISYWLPDFHLFFSVFNILEIKDNLLKFKPEAISIPYSSIRFYSKKFPNYPIHCWTNNMISEKDKIKIKNLSQMSNVKVILTDLKDNFLK